MFDGVADQFQHLIATRSVAASSSSSLPSSAPLALHHLPLAFTHLTSTPTASTTNAFAAAIFPGFDVYPSSSASSSRPQPHHLELQQPIPEFLHHQLHNPTTPLTLQKDEERTDEDVDELTCVKSLPTLDGEDCPWTDEEVLALIRIRSGIENWFPEVTWEHVSG
ncbi:hypothetical protein MLD38_038671 [Melastoma candidum]|nr:hypothetical protein MLD38_038671 [Melastoma candidum]